MKALVTGGNGFIGTHLVDALIARGHQVLVFDIHERLYDPMPADVRYVRGDIRQLDLVNDAVKSVDVVFHLSWMNVHEASNRDPAGDVSANLLPTINLIEACRLAGVKRFVFLSSGGTVYGEPRVFPTPEDHPQNPLSAYGITKLTVEKYLQLFHALHGFDFLVFRPSVPYGPRQNPLGRQGAVAVFLHRVATGQPITIWGDGSVSRDYFYVSDLVDAIIMGAQHGLGTEHIFNIGGAECISLLELLRRIEKIVGRDAKIEFGDSRKFDAGRVWLDTRRVQAELKWRPHVSLEEGLAQTWEWMKQALPATDTA